MSSRTCPDWPQLMELAPDLQFKHYTLAEAQLPSEVLVRIEGVRADAVSICCDLERHVFHRPHTEPEIADALADSHWYELQEWVESGPGAPGA